MVFNGVRTADNVAAPSNGLFSVAVVENHGPGDEHWINGFYVESLTCGVKISGENLCTSATGGGVTDLYDSSDGTRYFHVNGFGIIETLACENSVGFKAADGQGKIVELIKATTEFAVEKELWEGILAQDDGDNEPADRWLANAEDVTPTAGTGVKPKVALGLVEAAFAQNNPGVKATIHMSPLMAVLLDGSLDLDGDTYTTINGSLVAINRGGDPTVGPAAGGSDTEHWIYATGTVHVDLGTEELITESLSATVNAVTNEVIYIASRPSAVYFDGCSWYGALADATL